MATIDLSKTGTGPFFAASGQRSGVVRETIDLAAAQTAKGSALAASDIIKAIKVPAGTLVRQAGTKVTSASTGTTLTADLGIADSGYTGYDADGFNAAQDIKTANAEGHGAPGTDAYLTAGGFYCATATTIDLTLATVTAITALGKVEVYAIFDCLGV